jgi:peptidoglycan/xylan/chitin deacetylase (PgdA/CDA1 family)
VDVHWLDPVTATLDAASAPVDVFFRDDDAGWGTDRLLALLDVFARHDLPLDLAVIPAALDEELATELLRRRADQRLHLHQHGYAHHNHEPEGRKHEFGPHRSREEQQRDIALGAARLRDLLDDATQPIFTPPWNRCTADTGQALVALGFRVLSREARAAPLGIDGLDEIPIRVDWVKIDAIERLAAAIGDGGRVGVMFHHAEMDTDELARADELLALLAGDDRVRAAPMLGEPVTATTEVARRRPAASR